MYAPNHPYGSARFADASEVHRAFRADGGVPFGFYQGRKLAHSKQAGMLLIGGAGSGKFTSVLAHLMNSKGRGGEPHRYAIFDPKREIRAVLEPWLAHIGAAVYEINPYGVHGVSGRRVALLAHLTPDSPRLVGDSNSTACTLYPEKLSSSGEADFFPETAQRWSGALMRGLVHLDGEVSPTSIYELLSLIRSNPTGWKDMADLMASVGEPDIRITFDEMLTMAFDSPRTFLSVLGEMSNRITFMTDPMLQETFVGSVQADFSLEVLCEKSSRPVFVFFVMPPEMTRQNAPLIRLFFSSLRTLKQQRQDAPTLNLVIEEAAQLGRFPEIADFFSIGRGFGLCPIAVYQDIGQIKKNLGDTGAVTLSASADLEVYLGGGISDLETARQLSARLGNQTLRTEDHLVQERAKRAKREMLLDAMRGKADPFRTGLAMRALNYEQGHQTKLARPLRTPDEILRMSSFEALVMASKYGIPPFAIDKLPYFERPEYAGLYAPNPYFDCDLNSVSVKTRWGRKSLRVIREAVPASHADLPQYAHGEWAYIEGFRPKSTI